jgi:hypothetical protein
MWQILSLCEDETMRKERGDDKGCLWCLRGGSAGPAASGLSTTVKERGKPEAERDGTRAQPNPYAEAAEGHANETQSNLA